MLFLALWLWEIQLKGYFFEKASSASKIKMLLFRSGVLKLNITRITWRAVKPCQDLHLELTTQYLLEVGGEFAFLCISQILLRLVISGHTESL
jgi:hypothetical protein